jgi:hypothetical protein
MTARLSAEQARAAFMEAAGELWDELNRWYRQHPEATFKEMELQLRVLRRSLMGQALPWVLAQGDLGASPEAPVCEECGTQMEFKGYAGKEVEGLEGEGTLRRAYYVCPACGAGLFPPGPEIGSATPPLE